MDPRFALLLACFFLSGFAALLYQTAWTRELSFVFGTSELAVAAVLAAYMGGLALGAAAAARFAMRLRRPVLVYGVLELAIAICALLVPLGIRGLNALYVGMLGGADALPEGGSAALALFQLAGAFAVLLPPTAFMGATLPLLARHAVRRESEIGPRVGGLYAVNTAGAIAGTLCAAFWLMPELGLRRTVWAGAALNALVFALAALLARSAPLVAGEPERSAAPAATGAAFWILPAVALSGAVSFAYEVLWTRLLGYLLGASVHAFATMLASFLLGIALGSALASRLAATRERAAFGFALSQLGIGLASYAVFALADPLAGLAATLQAGPGALLPSAAVAVTALLPITLCIGATFPFAVRVLTPRADRAAAATARIYAWNTVGAIVGALGAGFVLLPGLGFEGTLSVGVAINLGLAALAALAATPRRLAPALAAGAALVALLLVPARAPWELLTSTPMRERQTGGEIVFAAVGRTSTVLLFDQGTAFRLSSNGLPEAAIDRKGVLPQIKLAQWLGALPALVRPEARDLLMVGLGGGTALELLPSSLESIDVIEIEPQILEAIRGIGPQRARNPLTDPRVRVHIGDARGALQLLDRRYDAIVSQPSHPWTAGASHLYTREFFSLVRSRLSPGGVFVQWIGMRFVDEALLLSVLATLADVFPHVELYRPESPGFLFVASEAPIDGLQGAARALRAAPDDFAPLGLHRLEDFAAAWDLDAEGTGDLVGGAPLNTDDHNRLASRAARLGGRSLDGESTRSLLAPHDPLLRAPGLDRAVLARVLTARGQRERAADLALAAGGADEEVGLGWAELGAERPARARRHFARALALAPEDPEALAGLLLTRKIAIASGADDPVVAAAERDPRMAGVIEGWRLAQAGDWSGVAGLDADLARIAPGDTLFGEASRLRINQRLAAGDPAACAEAMELAATMLSRGWRHSDAVLYARAAIGAGEPLAAWASLHLVASRLPVDARRRIYADRVLEIAKDLPEEMLESVRTELAIGPSRDRRPTAR